MRRRTGCAPFYGTKVSINDMWSRMKPLTLYHTITVMPIRWSAFVSAADLLFSPLSVSLPAASRCLSSQAGDALRQGSAIGLAWCVLGPTMGWCSGWTGTVISSVAKSCRSCGSRSPEDCCIGIGACCGGAVCAPAPAACAGTPHRATGWLRSMASRTVSKQQGLQKNPTQCLWPWRGSFALVIHAELPHRILLPPQSSVLKISLRDWGACCVGCCTDTAGCCARAGEEFMMRDRFMLEGCERGKISKWGDLSSCAMISSATSSSSWAE